MNQIARYMILAVSFFLTACSQNTLGEETPHREEELNNLEDVSLEMTETSYQAEGDTFELRVSNDSDEEISYGAPYQLEYYDDGVWYEVEPDEEPAFIMIAYLLGSGEEEVEEINMDFYEPLDSGQYRVIKEIQGEYLVAEFAVEE